MRQHCRSAKFFQHPHHCRPANRELLGTGSCIYYCIVWCCHWWNGCPVLVSGRWFHHKHIATNWTKGYCCSILGNSLLGGGQTITSISLGGVEVTSHSDGSDYAIVVVAAQASASNGPVAVEIVMNTGAVVTTNAVWEYGEASLISSLTPNSGQGGTRVLTSGSNFIGDTG